MRIILNNKILNTILPKADRVVSSISLLLAITTILVFIYRFGFPVTPNDRLLIHDICEGLLDFVLIITTIQLIVRHIRKIPIQKISTKIVYTFLYLKVLPIIFTMSTPGDNMADAFIGFIASKYYTYVILFAITLVNISIGFASLLKSNINPSRVIIIGFGLLITIGAGLLLLPNSTKAGISIVDAFFVSSSAVCVVGLTPVPITEVFTTMGQVIILSLIQLGGLGIMTLTCFFVFFFSGNMSVYAQISVKDAISSNIRLSLLGVLKSIFWTTVLVEATGAVFLWFSTQAAFAGETIDHLWFSVFHAISAFCNAGFSTLPGNLYNPLVAGNNMVILTISALIMFGGLGFPVFLNMIYSIGFRIKRLIRRKNDDFERQPFNLNTKIIIVFSSVLIIGGAVMIAMFEWHNAFEGMSLTEKISQSIFCSITPRTAGFNSLPMTSFTIQTTLITILLMWIGAGAQSTAGGIKINTIAVLYAALISGVKRKGKIELYHRQISNESVIHALSVVLLSFITISAACLILSYTNPHVPILNVFYEVVSAISTVGLSIDTTPTFNNTGRIVLTIVMFLGRVGVITLLWGLFKECKTTKYGYPVENIIIN